MHFYNGASWTMDHEHSLQNTLRSGAARWPFCLCIDPCAKAKHFAQASSADGGRSVECSPWFVFSLELCWCHSLIDDHFAECRQSAHHRNKPRGMRRTSVDVNANGTKLKKDLEVTIVVFSQLPRHPDSTIRRLHCVA